MYHISYCLVLVEENGQLPSKAHSTDAGFDVYATSDFSVSPGEIVKHPLNIRMQLPHGTYAEITSKSGNGSKGLLVYAGIIDEGYRGVVHVIMTNLNRYNPDNLKTIDFKKGQKIAQMIVHPYSLNYQISSSSTLDSNSPRGESGFGSTETIV